MANDCLVKKLRRSVANDSLNKLGVLKLNVHHYDGTLSSGYQYELTVKTNADVKVSVDGDGYFTVDNNELNNPSARKTEYTITTRGQKLFYFKNDNYNIEIILILSRNASAGSAGSLLICPGSQVVGTYFRCLTGIIEQGEEFS